MDFWSTLLFAAILVTALMTLIWLLKALDKVFVILVDLWRIAVRCNRHMRMVEKMVIEFPSGMHRQVAEDAVLLALETTDNDDLEAFVLVIIGDNRVYRSFSDKLTVITSYVKEIPAPDQGVMLWWVEVNKGEAKIWPVKNNSNNTWDIPQCVIA